MFHCRYIICIIVLPHIISKTYKKNATRKALAPNSAFILVLGAVFMFCN